MSIDRVCVCVARDKRGEQISGKREFIGFVLEYVPIEHVRYALGIIHCYQLLIKARFDCDLVIVLVQYDRAVMYSILIMVMVTTLYITKIISRKNRTKSKIINTHAK